MRGNPARRRNDIMHAAAALRNVRLKYGGLHPSTMEKCGVIDNAGGSKHLKRLFSVGA